jgi:TatD DNase family protein
LRICGCKIFHHAAELQGNLLIKKHLETENKYINIHSHLASDEGTISVFDGGVDPEALQKHKHVSIGIHPWKIHDLNIESALDLIKKHSNLEQVIFIGECGLDKLIDVPLKEQERIFIEQIKTAEKVRKPLLIHCVKAFEELIRIKKEQAISVPLIIHGFNNKVETAQQLIKQGFYLSFGKALLNESSNAKKVLEQMDPEKFFLETDDAIVSIKSIFEKASQLRKMDIEELKKQMLRNFKTIKNNG